MSAAAARVPTVALLGTLDTKGKEYAYLRDRIRERGVDVLLIDAGILGEPLADPDVRARRWPPRRARTWGRSPTRGTGARPSRRCPRRGGGRAAAPRRGRLRRDRGARRHRRHDARHARDAAAAIGVPKLMVSTAASGDTSRYFGPVDVTIMYSVVDIAGLNTILTRILVERRRCARRNGDGDGDSARRGEAVDRGLDVRCDDAVRDRGARAARGARLRGARLPPGRARRPVAGGGREDRRASPACSTSPRRVWPTRSEAASGRPAPSGSRSPGAWASPRSSRSAGSTRRHRPAGAAARPLRGPAALRARQRPGRDAADAGGVPADRAPPSRAS